MDSYTPTIKDVFEKYNTKPAGLSNAEALHRQKQYGLNILKKRNLNALTILIRQITSNPLIIILFIATCVSYILGQQTSSYYIIGLIILSIALGFWNEYSAERTVDILLKKISPTALLLRDGEKVEVPVTHVTIGDIVMISQGSIVPADLRMIETQALEMNESALTGESASVYKDEQSVEKKTDAAYMGTTVVSGSGTGIVTGIGQTTEFGKIAKISSFAIPATDFEKGLSNFGKLILKTIFILTFIICVVNTVLGHNILTSTLFALAIAVGMTPELLPVIVTISLSHGAGRLAKKKVISKRLISIENLGNMDVLCTDKTGTLTEGNVHVVEVKDVHGKQNDSVLQAALACNSAIVHHKVMGNPIDVAIWEYTRKERVKQLLLGKKVFDTPFDFEKKAMFSVFEKNGKRVLIVKGAPESVISLEKETAHSRHLLSEFHSLNENGVRVVAIAEKRVEKKTKYDWDDCKNAEYLGYISFRDIPKTSAKEAIEKLSKLNVAVKVITGDNELVTKTITAELGMAEAKILTGPEIAKLSEKELVARVNETEIFARVTPEQKLQVIDALKKNGHTVGYLGDGINDVPSLRTADVGISVNTAVDVAKDAASLVLLRKSLDVIVDGIIEGRETFNNTIKYILMSTSSNFGNMFSAAGASFILPFLPMTPVQILLTNGLYDISQLSIPTDNVDPESLLKPRHWNISFIKNYMIFFGPLSSLYDFLTFGVMIFFFHAGSKLFQTGWFIESLATEILVVFVIRTSRTPFFKSPPGKWLAATCLGIVAIGIALPFTKVGESIGFVNPPLLYFAFLILLTTTYIFVVELFKMLFLKKFKL